MPRTHWAVKTAAKEAYFGTPNLEQPAKPVNGEVNKQLVKSFSGGNQGTIKQFDSIPERKLWTSFHYVKDLFVRNQLVELYIEYATNEAKNYFHRKIPASIYVDLDDLIQDARIGLMNAVDAFNIERGTNFVVFSRSRIRGAIIDGLRTRQDFPRIVARLRRMIFPMMDVMRMELHRDPTVDEFCLRFGEDYRDTLDDGLLMATVHSSSAITDPSGDESSDVSSIFDIQSSIRGTDNNVRGPCDRMSRWNLVSLIDSLLPNMQDQIIITMYYFHNKTNRRIARLLKLSTSSVVLKHQEALRILQKNKSRISEELNA